MKDTLIRHFSYIIKPIQTLHLYHTCTQVLMIKVCQTLDSTPIDVGPTTILVPHEI